MGGTTAWMVASRVRGKGSEDSDESAYLKAAPGYVEAMYAGPKSSLRPIHDALVELGRSLGKDVRVCPCKTMVPFYREHVFAEVKPSSRTRIDLGRGRTVRGRFSGSFTLPGHFFRRDPLGNPLYARRSPSCDVRRCPTAESLFGPRKPARRVTRKIESFRNKPETFQPL